MAIGNRRAKNKAMKTIRDTINTVNIRTNIPNRIIHEELTKVCLVKRQVMSGTEMLLAFSVKSDMWQINYYIKKLRQL